MQYVALFFSHQNNIAVETDGPYYSQWGPPVNRSVLGTDRWYPPAVVWTWRYPYMVNRPPHYLTEACRMSFWPRFGRYMSGVCFLLYETALFHRGTQYKKNVHPQITETGVPVLPRYDCAVRKCSKMRIIVPFKVYGTDGNSRVHNFLHRFE